ncbi:DUF3825 domain-containing protein [Halorhodospira sp. 9621]|uniref:DUF3825 domain-containing protein n=1 Tax=Halorhodospira sp. 9621 TaxID=2899135 RepID=UPI001EE8E8BD|nr:DUF3825 domain-containing protein [Halorhodospira sp. 9621]MCG5531822.1 DUF3825 domain-containing protein [Halorhodospira sp. 9621]
MPEWPDNFHDLIFFPRVDEHIDALAALAEPEEWNYQSRKSEHSKPILYNYVKYTYKRLAEEEKIAIADNERALTFNTGLVTPSQEPLYCYCTPNNMEDTQTPWHFVGWKRQGERVLSAFSELPEMAHYFEDPKVLVLDPRKEIRTNVEHVVEDNRHRFPEPYRSMDSYALQTFLKGSIDNAKERVKRNYKTAIPQYYRGRVQLMLPLCIGSPEVADLALVVEDHGDFYRASTCLTLEMAYNNARQLARPDRDWLRP